MTREDAIYLEASKRIYRTEYVWAKRLRYTREVLQGLQRRFTSGPLSSEDMEQISYIWKLHCFAEAVRDEGNRLIADTGLTLANANWPVYESYTAPPLPTVWTDGIAQASVQGLVDDLGEVWDAIEADRAKLNRLGYMAYVSTASKSSSSLTETSVIPSGIGSLTIPSAVFDTPGTSLDFWCCGMFTNNGVAPISIRVKVGSQISLAKLGLVLPNLSNGEWIGHGRGIVRAGRVLSSCAQLGYDDGTTKIDSVVFSRSSLTIPSGSQTCDMSVQWASLVGSPSWSVELMGITITPPPA